MLYSHTGEGLHRFVDPADDRIYLYSQCEVPDARRIYATFEQPDLKSVFTFNVKAPAHWKVVSNSPTPAPVESPDGTAVWSFAETERMSTYVTAIVAGEYHEVLDVYQGKHGTIPLGHYCRQSVVQYLDTDELVEITKQGFEFFEDVFAFPYPFHKYDQLYVPEFNNGAMENAGCVTLRDEYLPRSQQARWFYEQRANTILHEMAHMWFGDLVTMRWWDDLWLNESFAEWAAHHAAVNATKYDEAWTGFTNHRKNWAYRQDQLPTTHPIAADNHDLEAVEVNFDGITYAKGASSLKQLVAYVGEESFLAGLRTYFQKHAFGNSEFQDLLTALEETSGRDLVAWANTWLQTAGVNTLAAEFTLDDDGSYASFAVRQAATAQFPTLRPHRIGIGLYDFLDGRLVRRAAVETDVDGESTDVPDLVGAKQPELLLLNDGDLSYAKIRLDERSQATVVASIHTLDDSLARALCWSAAWDMTRDAEMPAGDFISLVLRGLGSETDDTAVKQLPVYAQVAIEQFAHPSKRDALRSRVGEGLLGAAEGRPARKRQPADLDEVLRRHARKADPAVVVHRRGPQRGGHAVHGGPARRERSARRSDRRHRHALDPAHRAGFRWPRRPGSDRAGARLGPDDLRAGEGRSRAGGAARPGGEGAGLGRRGRSGECAQRDPALHRLRVRYGGSAGGAHPVPGEVPRGGRDHLGGPGRADRVDRPGVHVPPCAHQRGDARPGRPLAGGVRRQSGCEALRRRGQCRHGPRPEGATS